MLHWIARAFFLRFLPRRLLPMLTLFELFLLLRGVRKRWGNQTASSTAQPAPLPRPASRP